MDGFYCRLEGKGGLSHAWRDTIKHNQRERGRKKVLLWLNLWESWLIWQVGSLRDWFLFLLHLQSTQSSRRRVVLSAALKGENWRTSWQLSLVTEAEATQCSSSERTGFRGCQMCSALSSAPTKRDRLIEMWAVADISVFPRLSPISFSFLSQSLTV